MSQNTNELHAEIKQLARMQALTYTRIYLLLASFLCMLYYLAMRYGLYCTYVFFIALLGPFFIELIPSNASSRHNEFQLTTLHKEYGYEPLRHMSLYCTFWLCNLLLIVWILRIQVYSTANTLANSLPTVLLFGNILCFLLLFYYFRIKFHFQLLNNRW